MEVLSPLIRSPGAASAARSVEGAARRTAYQSASRVVGRTANARAGFHTASRARSAGFGFGSIRPTAAPRSSSQVGLQTARNFSSSRPVFQNVVQNAPLGARVLGDKDKLDLRRFRREMRAAYLKKRSEAGKGKARANQTPAFDKFKITVPASMDAYFPQVLQDIDTDEVSVQLVLPLNPVSEATPFLSYNDDATESKFFSAMLMSDLRLLSEIHGVHHARLRNMIHRLESAGCFEVDPGTGRPSVRAELDELHERIVVSFLGERWSLADVRQVLGLWDGQATTWYQLVDLSCTVRSPTMTTSTVVPSEFESSISVGSISPPSTLNLDEDEVEERTENDFEPSTEYNLVSQTFVMPQLDHSTADVDVDIIAGPPAALTASQHDSYIWGVEDFIHGLHTSRKPAFRGST